MKRNIQRTSTAFLNSVFFSLEQKNPDCIFWIRDHTMTKQFYVSGQFSSVWGHKIQIAYDVPMIWFTSLEKEKLDYYMHKAQCRHDANYLDPKLNPMLYQIINTDGEIISLKDTCCHCKCPLGNQYVIGISKEISADSWHSQYQRNHCHWDEKEKFILDQALVILHDAFGWVPMAQQIDEKLQLQLLCEDFAQNFNQRLTPRELECLKQLCLGKTAKQTANALNVSPRTVETHLENIRIKTNLNSKLSLIHAFGHYFNEKSIK